MNKKLFDTKIREFSKKIKAINHLGGKCKKCGNTNIFHLVFHHKIPEEKEMSVSYALKLSWRNIIKEIEKCELLCENCHQEFHYVERGKIIKDDSKRKDKIIYLSYKGVKCVKCGYDKCESSLSFHHRDTKTKSFDIGSLSKRIDCIEDLDTYIKKELDKCEVICRNCHIQEHTDYKFFNENIEQIYDKINMKEISKKINRVIVWKYHNEKLTNKKIAEILGCGKSTISDILRGRLKNDKKIKEKYLKE